MPPKRVFIAGAIAAFVIGLAAYFLFFRASDEQKIRDAVARAVAVVTVTEDDTNPIVRLGRVRGVFKDVVDKDVRVRIAELPQVHAGRDSLAEAVVQASAWFKTAEIDLASVEVKLDDAHKSAQVRAVATLRAVGRDGRSRNEEREVTLLVTKPEGTWRIGSVTVWPPKDE